MEENKDIMIEAEPEAAESVDERIARALEAARLEWQAALEERLQGALSEVARVQQMTDEERTAYAADRREAELSAREARLVRRELRAEALEMLAQRGLPGELADALGYDNRETLLASLDKVERVFRQEVQKGVEQRLRGAAPAAGAGAQGDPNQLDDAEYYRLNYPLR